jgi:3-deoxy-7-phosphoheptulonate synthase
VVANGATVLRGGAFKPRTSPYSFQGLGVEGLRYLAEARERTGLPVITEVMEPSQVDIVAEYADILQIGTRNMQNFSLLLACGRAGRPVMLKRGFGATIEEWLMAAEYIASAGNSQIIMCERGIRTFETFARNTLDLTAVPAIHHLTHLPVVVDPSHATGKRWLVKPLAIGGAAVGADGLMVEVHPRPDEALSDAEQQLDLDQFADLMTALVPIHEHVRALHGDPAAAVADPSLDSSSKH